MIEAHVKSPLLKGPAYGPASQLEQLSYVGPPNQKKPVCTSMEHLLWSELVFSAGVVCNRQKHLLKCDQ